MSLILTLDIDVLPPPPPHETLRVVGSTRSLGRWRPDRGLPLRPEPTPERPNRWVAEIAMPMEENPAAAEYKYVLTDGRGGAKWMDGGNRGIEVPDVKVEKGDGVWDRSEEAEAERAKAVEEVEYGVADEEAPAVERVAVVAGTTSAMTPVPKLKPVSTQDTADWYADAVFYHIFPLGSAGDNGRGVGFFDVPHTNDRKSEPVDRLLKIRDYYDHFAKLGISAIYFSPLFESKQHGYDTADYFTLDRRLGTNDTFKTVLSELHERGIRVMLDGVFNHTGRSHFAFKDLLAHGNDVAKSEYSKWYYVDPKGRSGKGDPFKYKSWEGHEELPRLNLNHPPVRQHIFDVARFWLKDIGIDGFRLDVASEIEPPFWAEFRGECESFKPGAVLVGEIIHGDYNHWVAPREGLLHSCTNYQLYKAMWSALNDKNYFELAHSVQRDTQMFGKLTLLNFVSNHDVNRIASQLSDPNHIRLAYFFLMTARGTPCIYYGDELEMRGDKKDSDAAVRHKMPPPSAFPSDDARDLFLSLCALSSLRKTLRALARGDISIVHTANRQLAFLRDAPAFGSGEHENVLVAMNCDSKPARIVARIEGVGLRDEDVLRHQWGPLKGTEVAVARNQVELEVGAYSGVILSKE